MTGEPRLAGFRPPRSIETRKTRPEQDEKLDFREDRTRYRDGEHIFAQVAAKELETTSHRKRRRFATNAAQGIDD
jgi:hypothetical protein